MANVLFIIVVQSFKSERVSSVISVFTFESYLHVIISTDALHNNIAPTVLTTSVLICFPLFLVFCSSIFYFFLGNISTVLVQCVKSLTCLTSVSFSAFI